jgi:uncharacterized phage protein (TIGR02218 family)
MKTQLAGIPALNPGVVAELYTITLRDESVLRYTTADIDLVRGGHTFLSGVLLIERQEITTGVGVEVADVSLSLYAPDDFTLSGQAFSAFVNGGGFDGAHIKIERARTGYTVHLFEGLVTDANADFIKADITVSAPTVLLNIEMPRYTYKAGCIYTVYDNGCGVLEANFANPATAASGSTSRRLNCALAQADGYFDLGKVVFTSGANNGAVRSIKNYAPGVVTLSYPLSVTPAVGDAFTAYPGCDGRRTTCKDVFDNEANYRGYPYIPVPEASL